MRVEYSPAIARQIDPRGNLIRIGATHINVRIDPGVADGWCEVDTDGVTVGVNAETWERINQ